MSIYLPPMNLNGLFTSHPITLDIGQFAVYKFLIEWLAIFIGLETISINSIMQIVNYVSMTLNSVLLSPMFGKQLAGMKGIII